MKCAYLATSRSGGFAAGIKALGSSSVVRLPWSAPSRWWWSRWRWSWWRRTTRIIGYAHARADASGSRLNRCAMGGSDSESMGIFGAGWVATAFVLVLALLALARRAKCLRHEQCSINLPRSAQAERPAA